MGDKTENKKDQDDKDKRVKIQVSLIMNYIVINTVKIPKIIQGWKITNHAQKRKKYELQKH